jgi:predicted ATPase
MITKLRFKNWRSLKDVTINDLQPINVFIGANSSGKTNVLDALYFLRESTQEGALRAVQNRGGAEKVHTIGVDIKEPIEVEFTFRGDSAHSELTYMLGLEFDKPNMLIPNVAESLEDNNHQVWLRAEYQDGVWIRHNEQEELKPLPEPPFGWEQTVLSAYGGVSFYPQIYQAFQFITQRWQLLDENFMPSLSVPFGSSGDLMVIDRCADNVPIMLDFLRKVEPELYGALQEDLRWLLTHVTELETASNDTETRYLIKEKMHGGEEAPSVSGGTGRLVGILAAYYALQVKQRAKSPGLLVIEEADTALNPGLLRNFVEQLRNYTEGEHPRQFILTTHNPRFLDYFEPNEVRVVSRDETGYTRVDSVSEHIREIWGDEYNLGEVWMTNSIGGLQR